MSTSRTDNVKSGVWTDHSQRFGFRMSSQSACKDPELTVSGSQWLVTDFYSNFITNILGILVPIAGARVFRISLRVSELCGIFHQEARTSESLAWSNIRAGLDVLGQGALHLGPQPPIPHTLRREAWRYLGMAFGLLIIFATFLAFGVFTAFLATSTIALSNHPDCGLYIAQAATWSSLMNISRPYESAAQTESAALAASCLDHAMPDCGLFTQPAFSVTVENYTCPFAEHMCYGEGVSPIRMSTGAVSARNIGINSPGLLEFNRTTVCSPLNMNRTYINLARQEGSKYTFGYYYGRSVGWDTASYETVRRADRGDVPTYELGALWSDGTLDASASWWPIESLVPDHGSTTTLIIIVSQKINYLEKRLDPIFPAEDNMTIPGDPRTFYINLSGPGTALACVDRTEYRDRSISLSWFPLNRLPTKGMGKSENANALYLMINSLVGSNIFGTLNLRLAAALDAESRIAGFVSLPLAKEQWKTEVQKLFNVSLARVMINARDISRGAKSGYWGFQKLPRTAVDICHETYLMQVIGWRNINFTGALWVLAVGVIIILLSIPFTQQNVHGDEEEALSAEYAVGGIIAFCRGLAWLCREVWRLAQNAWASLPPWTTVMQTVSQFFGC